MSIFSYTPGNIIANSGIIPFYPLPDLCGYIAQESQEVKDFFQPVFKAMKESHAESKKSFNKRIVTIFDVTTALALSGAAALSLTGASWQIAALYTAATACIFIAFVFGLRYLATPNQSVIEKSTCVRFWNAFQKQLLLPKYESKLRQMGIDFSKSFIANSMNELHNTLKETILPHLTTALSSPPQSAV